MLKKGYPEIADKLFEKAERDLTERYETYKRMAKD